MLKTRGKNALMILIGLLVFSQMIAQDSLDRKNYIGILPSILIEPYDTLNAVEVNILPLVYERKLGESLGIEIRPIINYRIHKEEKGISQTGGTILVNKYLHSIFEEDFWILPLISGYYTYTYNQLDKINTMTLGIEPGVVFQLKKYFSINLKLQPGINYYPDTFSREFVETESGFKPHFGVIFHIGYNF